MNDRDLRNGVRPDALDALPEHLKSRKTADAVMSPGAILAGGVGASAVVLLGAPLLLAVPIGAAVYGGIVALRLPKRRREPRIEPGKLPQPWRDYVVEALDAQRRYHAAIATTDPGPLREQLNEIGARVDAGVRETWKVSQRGAQLDGALTNLDEAGIQRDRSELDAQWHDADAHARAREALDAREASTARLRTVRQETSDKVRVLNARLDEVVARAVELSLQAADAAAVGGLGSDVDAVVSDMEALRQALDEASGTSALGNGDPAPRG